MRGVSRSQAEKENWLAQYKASGLSANAFAKREHLPPSTFFQWLADSRRATRVPRIARVLCGASSAGEQVWSSRSSGLLIEVGNARIHVGADFDRTALAAVIDVLGARGQKSAS